MQALVVLLLVETVFTEKVFSVGKIITGRHFWVFPKAVVLLKRS
jgi:hypothetical protein